MFMVLKQYLVYDNSGKWVYVSLPLLNILGSPMIGSQQGLTVQAIDTPWDSLDNTIA